jgi:putative spermidine/putrescine transport system ATP-binding protein
MTDSFAETPAVAQDISPLPIASHTGHELLIEDINHRFGSTIALRHIYLHIAPGEFVSLLGPSGCGKTTLLRLIAGFLKPTQGCIRVDGVRIDPIPAHKRNIGVVFQNYALFPHMTIQENVAYGLRAQHRTSAEIRARVQDMLELVKLDHYRDRYPNELSGGQQQRVALARAIAVEPKILLLDEPFSALDKNLRLDMQIEVKRLIAERKITTLFVTHDQEEALSMSDRIAVMSNGVVQQFDTPTRIYDQPASLFVSNFVGTSNLLSGQILKSTAAGCAIALPGQTILRTSQVTHLEPGSPVVVAVRPENFSIHHDPAEQRLPATVDLCMSLGSVTVYEMSLIGGQSIKVTQPRSHHIPMLRSGQQVFLELVAADACCIFSAS